MNRISVSTGIASTSAIVTGLIDQPELNKRLVNVLQPKNLIFSTGTKIHVQGLSSKESQYYNSKQGKIIPHLNASSANKSATSNCDFCCPIEINEGKHTIANIIVKPSNIIVLLPHCRNKEHTSESFDDQSLSSSLLRQPIHSGKNSNKDNLLLPTSTTHTKDNLDSAKTKNNAAKFPKDKKAKKNEKSSCNTGFHWNIQRKILVV